MIEQVAESNYNKEFDNYSSGLVCYIYDWSDLYPRGSLRSDTKFPPYPLSEMPDDLLSTQDVYKHLSNKTIGAILFKSIYRSVESAREYESGEYGTYFEQWKLIPTWDVEERIEPEKIDERLTRKYLENETIIARGYHRMPKAGDKLALIYHEEAPQILYVANLNTGVFIRLEKDEKQWRDKRERIIQVDPPEKEFEETDLKGPGLLEAIDKGDRKYESKTSLKFAQMMTSAEVLTERVLYGEHLENAVHVTDAIKRPAKRRGRTFTRDLISEFRQGGYFNYEDIIQEMSEDILFASRLHIAYEPIKLNPKQIKHSLKRIFIAESGYLDAAIHLPWNRVGPQAIDTAIEVFWFRYQFDNLSFETKLIHEAKSKIRSYYYKMAAIDRMETWFAKEGYGWYEWGELVDLGLIPESKAERKKLTRQLDAQMGPISDYLSKDSLKEDMDNMWKKYTPNGLTKLLWKTLKYAQPQQWKNTETVLASRYELLDEMVADPRWLELGDHLGRVVLPGESLSNPLPHLVVSSGDNKKGARFNIGTRQLAFAADGENMPYSLGSLNINLEDSFKSEKPPKAYESIVGDFNKTIATIPIDQLLARVINMPSGMRAVVLSRLGYFVPEELEIGNYSIPVRFSPTTTYSGMWSSPVRFYTNALFDGNSYQYYQEVKKATKALSENPPGQLSFDFYKAIQS